MAFDTQTVTIKGAELLAAALDTQSLMQYVSVFPLPMLAGIPRIPTLQMNHHGRNWRCNKE